MKKLDLRYLSYIPLILLSFFYLLPMYMMTITGLKGLDEVSIKTMLELPKHLSIDNFVIAFKELSPYLWNSFRMVIPAAVISSFLGSINGYILAKWKFKGADIIFRSSCLECSYRTSPS